MKLVFSEENNEDLINRLKAMDTLPMTNSTPLADYKFRFVKNQIELQEKAIIFDCGLDDRVFELLKIHYKTMFSKEHPDITLGNIYFHRDNNKSYIFIFLTENDDIYTIDFDNALNDEVAKTRKIVIDERSKECFYIKAKVLREKNMTSYFKLSFELGFSNEFINELHSIIHKRFLTVCKYIRNELAKMVPKKATTPPTKKKK